MTPEQELALLRQQHAALLRAIAHDLTAPLRHIQSFAPLLHEAVQDLAAHTTAVPAAQEAAADALEFSRFMQEGASKLGQMVQALAQLSQAVRRPLALDTVDALQLIQRLTQQYIEQHCPQAVCTYDSPGPVLLQADRQALGDIVLALLDNACKFAAPTPQLHWQLQAQGDGGWRLALRDNGVGFAPEQAAQLGQPFVRLHRASEFPGLGCGLAQAATLAQRHGGQLQLTGQLGQGCTATLHWPGCVALATD